VISHPSKIQIVIASKHCLISTGIQAFIGMMGMNVHYIEFTGIDNVLTKNNNSDYFLFLHHNLLELPKKDHFKKILATYKGKIMVLGSNNMDIGFHQHIILPSDDELAVLNKVEQFFSKKNCKSEVHQSDVLSSREIEVLKEVALGYSNKEIAERLFISINTVITHRKNITEKLGIKTISGLTVYALMNNLINPKDVTF